MRNHPVRPSIGNPWVFIATWCGSGHLPKAPGTWGSLAALPIAWLILEHVGTTGLLFGVCVVFAVGIAAADRYMALVGRDDPGAVVVDEVAGQWLALLFVPLDPLWFLAGFIAFRVFDIFKPWPVRALERRFKGGFGVMIDDIAAGVYALAALWLVEWSIGTVAL
ncbi:MAG: phosphatidylglycerophosphatase A [Rhodospirillales bacterium]